MDEPVRTARAAVLARLWGALVREPIPGLRKLPGSDARAVLAVPDGRRLTGPATAAEPFAPAPPRLTVTFDGQPYDDPGRLLAALPLPVSTAGLVRELDNSVANLALARAAQPPPGGGRPALTRPGLTLADLEQCVVDGHPLHPCCRTRMGMSAAEVRAYAPEHHPVVEVELVEVPADRWLSTGAGLPPRLPVHPWQRDHVLDRYPGLRPTGERVSTRPLMALRTVAPATEPEPGGARRRVGGHRHWKTAVDVQMTSAVRTVSPAAVRNGPVVSELVATLATGTGSGLTMLREVAAGAVLVDGEACRSLAVTVRQAPVDLAIPLAALAAPSPADGRPLAVEVVTLGYGGDPVRYFADLCRIMLPPLLTLLHAGVALEAHGQNTLLGLRGGRLAGLLYRDVGGVRISPSRLRAHGVDPPPLHGDVGSDDPAVLRTKLLAAAVSGGLAEQVAVLGREYGTPPDRLWAQAAATARQTYRRLPAAAGGDAGALFDTVVPIKATTAMRLAADPLEDVWAWRPNPLAGLW